MRVASRSVRAPPVRRGTMARCTRRRSPAAVRCRDSRAARGPCARRRRPRPRTAPSRRSRRRVGVAAPRLELRAAPRRCRSLAVGARPGGGSLGGGRPSAPGPPGPGASAAGRSSAASLAIAVALQSGIERYDTTLFSIHMVQHLLLTLVAPPLLALGAPVTQLLRAASPGTREPLDPAGPPLAAGRGVLAHPVVAWLVFTLGHVGDALLAALRPVARGPRSSTTWSTWLYLGAALLFWWPVVGLDPAPHRMGYPARLLYLFLQMPQNSFLGDGDPVRGRAALPALRDARVAVRDRRPRRPAPGGRPDVVRGRRALPRARSSRSSSAGCAHEERGCRERRPPRRRRAGRDPRARDGPRGARSRRRGSARSAPGRARRAAPGSAPGPRSRR